MRMNQNGYEYQYKQGPSVLVLRDEVWFPTSLCRMIRKFPSGAASLPQVPYAFLREVI
jgi:hypothetical protein